MSQFPPPHPEPKPTRAISHATSSTTHSAHLQTPNDEKRDFAVNIHMTGDSKSPPSHPPSHPLPISPLFAFHSALGIPPPIPPKPGRSFFGRKKHVLPTPHPQPLLSSGNKGIYLSIVSNERSNRLRYQACDAFISITMFLQIIVGAAVTAFGAGSADHTIITVFGAANTALAGLMAVLKSQGLPNRLRQDWKGWLDLKEYVEAKEREVEMYVSGRAKDMGDHSMKEINIWETIKDIERRYDGTRLTSEVNRPDTYIKL